MAARVADESLVVALLATPIISEKRPKKDSKKDGNRRFKAESGALRNSDLSYLMDAVEACSSLSAAHRGALKQWSRRDVGLVIHCKQLVQCNCASRAVW